MLIFIDESGIHKKEKHSVIAFVYVCVKDTENLEKEIEKIERNLNITNFHWSDFGSKFGWQIRKEFLKRASKLNFTFKIAIIRNPVYFPATFKYCFEYLIIEKKIKKIVIDGKKPRWYEKQLKKTLRDKGVSVKKIKTLNDKSSAGLRLADALAGLARSHCDNSTETTEDLYKLFENKITAQLVGGQKTR